MTLHTQSLAGYIRQHIDELEARLEVGVRHEAIVAELKAQGYTTTVKGFRNYLYRARQWAKEKHQRPQPPSKEKPNASSPVNLEPPKEEKPEDPLMKNRGFSFKGTLDKSDLI
jgi:hypothetical protein